MRLLSLLFTVVVSVVAFAQVPTITSLSTYSANVGASVTITGTGFDGATASNNKVYFGGVKASVTSASTTQLTVLVPRTTSTSTVSVMINGLRSNSKKFLLKNTSSGSLSLSWSSQYFSTPTTVTLSSVATTYAWEPVDVDNDGDMDFVTAGSTGTLQIIVNGGATSSFTMANSNQSSITLNSALAVNEIKSADFNNDGYIDFAVSFTSGRNVEIIKNNGNGTYASQGVITFNNLYSSAYVNSITLEDFNNDGFVDVLASSYGTYSSSAFQIFSQSSTTAFSFSNYYSAPAGASYWFTKRNGAADVNNDGYLDVFVLAGSGTGTQGLNVALGTSTGFNSMTNISGSTDMYGYTDFSFVDFDNDGDLDVACPGQSNMRFYTNNGSGVFTYTSTSYASRFTELFDIDNDSDLDLIGSSYFGIIGSQNVNGTYATSTDFSGSIQYTGESQLIDLNGDGYLDVAFLKQDGTTMYAMIFQGNPSPPSITSNLANTALSYCQGSTPTALSITASGATSYQWQSSPDNLNWTNINGATNSSYTPSTLSASTLYYRCVATNSYGSQNSAATGLVTVSAGPTLTTNLSTTLSQYCYNYSSTTALTVATSASSPSYQWQVSSDNSSFSNVVTANGSGGTTASFIPSHVDIWYGGTKYYRCLVTSNGCSTTSNTKPFGVYADLTQVTIPSTANVNYCIGATPTNLVTQYTGVNVTYQWSWCATSNGTYTNIVGATGTTYTPPTNAANTRYYRCYVNAICSNTTKTSGAITVTDTYTWTGATSSDPSIAGNWNPAAVPCSGANEVIPTGLTNYPSYTNLTIDAGTTLTVQSGAKMDISGVLTNNGTLTIESGATLIQGASSTLAGSGTYNVKQNITGAGSTTPTGRFWYLGSPVSLSSSSVYFGNAANVVKKRDESTNSWVALSSGTPENLVVGKGYYTQATANSTITFTGGVVNNGAITINGLTRTAGQSFEGFNLVSNPYPSYLNWDAVTRTNVDGTMWYRTNDGSNMVFDTYVANAAGGIGTNLGGTSVTKFIPPMQSFWVRVSQGQTSGSLTLGNAMRSHFSSLGGSTAGLKSTNDEPSLFLRMNLLQAGKKDQLIVYVNETATNGFDALDGEKMMQAGYPQFYTKAADKKIVINGLNSAKKQQALPITMELPTTGVHSFIIEDLEISNGLVWLEDKQEEIIQALEPGTVYEFFANSGMNSERFVLHFQLIDDAVPTNVYNEVNSSANFSGKGASVHAEAAGVVVIKLPAATEGVTDIQITDAAGKVVYTGSTNNLETSVQLAQANGIYYVTLNSTSGVEVRKVFIQQ